MRTFVVAALVALLVVCQFGAHSAQAAPDPSLTLSPYVGSPGQTTTISGTGFPAGQQVAVFWDCSTATCSPGQRIASTRADQSGAFSVPFTVPRAPYGGHSISAVGVPSGTAAQTFFQITPALTLTPVSGGSQWQYQASGVGFGASENVILYLTQCPYVNCPKQQDVVGSAVTDQSGSFSTVVNLHTSYGATGSHAVIAVGQTTGAQAGAPYTVTPQVTASPTSGPAGTVIHITGTGFRMNSSVVVCVYIQRHCPSQGRQFTTTDQYGDFSIDYVMPTTPDGMQQILVEGDFTSQINNPLTFYFTFDALMPMATLSTQILDFGTIPKGNTSNPRTVAVTNTGRWPLSISSVTLAEQSPSYHISGDACTGAVLQPGKSCAISVTFAPVIVGAPGIASLSISDSAYDSPQTVRLRGQGGSPQP